MELKEALRRYLPAKPLGLLPTLFKLCAATAKSSFLAAQLHADAAKLPLSVAASNSILSYYLHSSRLHLALAHFRSVSTPKDSVTYNALIHFLAGRYSIPAALRFFALATRTCFRPNVGTLVTLLRSSCKDGAVCEGVVMHGYLVKTGFLGDSSVHNSVIAMYAGFEDVSAARKVFDEMTRRDVVSWSTMIGACLGRGSGAEGLGMFREMVAEGAVEVDGVAAVVALRACGLFGDLGVGRSVHGVAVRGGLESDVFTANSLVDMYAKCLDLESAQCVFALIAEKTVVSWNSMLSGLVHSDKCSEALQLFALLMGDPSVDGDETTLVVLLQLCKKLGQAMWCRSVHAVAVRKLFLVSMPLLNALLDAYAKCGLVELALLLFQQMVEKNVITWSTIVAACAHNGRPHEAIACFAAMQESGEKPNSITMLSLLEACANCAEIGVSRSAHGVALRSGLALELDASNALLVMYAKCGDLAASTRVFHAMPVKDVLTWNAMIGALGMNGRASDALALLHRMESSNVKPNGITMLAMLSACAHGGLVQEGIACFERMTRVHSLQPLTQHLSCVVDMLGRVGDLHNSIKVIESMSEGANASSSAAWSALLSACRSHGDCEVARDAASHVLELEPANSAGYLLSMNIYAMRGSSATTARLRSLMREKGVKVVSGHSLVHVGHKSHKFVSWDGSHPERAEVYSMLEFVHWHMTGCNKTRSPITWR